MSDQTASVPLSQTLSVGQRDRKTPGRDNSGTNGGALSIKALAEKVLQRDSHRDSGETTSIQSCPTRKTAVGQTFEPVPLVPVDDLDERAAIIAEGAGVPKRWAEGFAALSSIPAPAGFSPERWQRIIDAAGIFIDKWAAKAAECGWSDLDVFGVNPDAPGRRFDAMGVVLLLDHCEVVAVDERGADLVANGGARLRYRRRAVPADTVSLWALNRP
jgi:hypothetical protein